MNLSNDGNLSGRTAGHLSGWKVGKTYSERVDGGQGVFIWASDRMGETCLGGRIEKRAIAICTVGRSADHGLPAGQTVRPDGTRVDQTLL